MKICARCFGANIGHIIAILLFAVGLLPPWYYSLILFGVLLFDWSLQAFLKIMSNSTRRVITGIIGGIGVGSLIWSGVLFLIVSIKHLF